MARSTKTQPEATPEVEEAAIIEANTPEPEEAPIDVAALLAEHAQRVEAVKAAEAIAQMTREAIASVIRSAREARGEARPQVCRRAGVTVAQLAAIELGREATTDELRSLGTALGIDALAAL